VNRAKVYFTDLRAKPGKNLLDKLKKLVLEAGIKEIDFKKKFVSLKIHFGEPENFKPFGICRRAFYFYRKRRIFENSVV